MVINSNYNYYLGVNVEQYEYSQYRAHETHWHWQEHRETERSGEKFLELNDVIRKNWHHNYAESDIV